MSRIAISLLGPFQATIDGHPATQFRADSARALLAYLAMAPDVVHRRARLAGLLWPEQPDADALRNLRVALSRLRDAIGDRGAAPPFLFVSRTSIELNPQAAVSLDVRTFRALLAATKGHDHERLEACAACARQLGEAAALYRGEFLAGFSLDSAPFEEWLVVEREGLHWQALQALAALAAFHEGRGEYREAITYARRQVELEPWHEGAHRQWMRALALIGHRGTALAQYKACRRVLADELGVEPEEETRALYEQIREGKLAFREATAMPSEPEQEIGQVGAPSLARAPPAVGKAAPPSPGVPTLGQVEGERRSVTAVLVHVEGATELLVRVGTEDWAEVMGQILHLLGQEVARFGGELFTPGGDELVAFFGARMAHEDDPERAVLAALAMQSSFAQWLGVAIDPRMADRLGLRIAVHAGEVVVTSMGDHLQQSQAAVMGEAIAFARQLLAAVRPDVTLVSERTFRQVAPLFDWEVGQHVHTGAAGQTWTAYRPLAHKALPGKGRGIVGLSSPLVGRESELDALHKALERLHAGVGGIITLVGEAGIGKSRLVAEARRAATEVETQGMLSADPQPTNLLWAEGRCLSYKTAVAYGLWVDVVHRLLGLTSPTTLVALCAKLRELVGERIHDVYPFLGQMMTLPLEEQGKARLGGLDGESLRFLTFRAVETLLDHAAQQRALVLVCEDLHWADPTSLALLEQLLALTDRLPLLFICVFRPEMQHGCWHIKETATRLYHHRHADLWLHPLGPVEGERLVGNLLRVGDLGPQRVEGLPHELRERILDRAGGNPFFMEEILRSLIDREVISYDERAGRWQAAKDLSDMALPDTVRGVLAARMDRLPQGAKQVLQLVSVIGRILPYPLLAAIAERSRLDDHLVALQRAGMIRERARVPEVEYIFKHVLIQEVTYAGLLRRARRALHRRVAEALESMYPERIQEQLGLLAYHWEQAGEAEQAVHYLRRAGEQAAAQYANQEAITYFARAFDIVPPEDTPGRYGLLLVREAVYDLQGDREAQYQDLTALRELANALADTRRQAEVALRQANYDLRVGGYQAGAANAQRAVSLAQEAADAAIEAAARREWGRALFYQTDYEAARPQVERALAMAGELGLCQVQADCLHTLGAIFSDLGAYVDAKVYFGKELTVCQEMGDRRGEGVALRDLGLASVYLGEREGAETCLQQSLRICREVGNRRDEAWALVGLGDASSFYGDYSRAKAYHQESVSLCRETRARLGETRSLNTLGQVSWALGAYGEALDYLQQSQRVASDLAYLGLQGWALLTLGGVYAELGKYGEARECLERSLHLAREMGSSLYEGYTLPHLALVSHYLDDDQAAWQHAQAALRLRQHFVGLFIAGYALTALGHVLVDLGHLDEAADAYRQAVQLRRRLNQHHLVVAPLAGLLDVATEQGDRLRAGTLVEEVLSELNARPMPEGTTEPFRIHLSAYRALRAKDDPRAGQVLHTAHRLLCERAAKIEDEEMRRSFLENVPAHREIVDAFAQGL